MLCFHHVDTRNIRDSLVVSTLNRNDYRVSTDVTFDAYVNFPLSLRVAVSEHLRLRYGSPLREIDSNEIDEFLEVIGPLRHDCVV